MKLNFIKQVFIILSILGVETTLTDAITKESGKKIAGRRGKFYEELSNSIGELSKDDFPTNESILKAQQLYARAMTMGPAAKRAAESLVVEAAVKKDKSVTNKAVYLKNSHAAANRLFRRTTTEKRAKSKEKTEQDLQEQIERIKEELKVGGDPKSRQELVKELLKKENQLKEALKKEQEKLVANLPEIVYAAISEILLEGDAKKLQDTSKSSEYFFRQIKNAPKQAMNLIRNIALICLDGRFPYYAISPAIKDELGKNSTVIKVDVKYDDLVGYLKALNDTLSNSTEKSEKTETEKSGKTEPDKKSETDKLMQDIQKTLVRITSSRHFIELLEGMIGVFSSDEDVQKNGLKSFNLVKGYLKEKNLKMLSKVDDDQGELKSLQGMSGVQLEDLKLALFYFEEKLNQQSKSEKEEKEKEDKTNTVNFKGLQALAKAVIIKLKNENNFLNGCLELSDLLQKVMAGQFNYSPDKGDPKDDAVYGALKAYIITKVKEIKNGQASAVKVIKNLKKEDFSNGELAGKLAFLFGEVFDDSLKANWEEQAKALGLSDPEIFGNPFGNKSDEGEESESETEGGKEKENKGEQESKYVSASKSSEEKITLEMLRGMSETDAATLLKESAKVQEVCALLGGMYEEIKDVRADDKGKIPKGYVEIMKIFQTLDKLGTCENIRNDIVTKMVLIGLLTNPEQEV